MAKKSSGFVELEWQCPNCSNKNAGAVKTCGSCGSPQPVNVQFQQKAQAEILKDENQIKAASQGADFHCPYCDARNPANAETCSQCGGDIREGKRRVSGTVMGAFGSSPSSKNSIKCSNCGTENAATTSRCSACGAVLNAGGASSGGATLKTEQKPVVSQPSSFRPWMALPILAILFGVCVILGFIFFRTETRIGRVEQVEWNRFVEIQALTDVKRSDWEEKVPADAQAVSCSEKLYTTQDESAPGAIEVCGTPYEVDQGNGYAEVVQDCSYEVYANYCEFTVKDWGKVDELTSTGADFSAYWPDVTLGEGQREGERKEKYTIYFMTETGPVTYTTDDEALFLQLTPGTQWTLEMDSFGNVLSVSP